MGALPAVRAARATARGRQAVPPLGCRVARPGTALPTTQFTCLLAPPAHPPLAPPRPPRPRQVHTWREANLRARLPEVQPSLTRAPLLDGSEEEASASPDVKALAPAPCHTAKEAHPQKGEAGQMAAPGSDGAAAAMSAADAATMPARWKAGGSSLGRLGGQLLGCLNFRMTRTQVGWGQVPAVLMLLAVCTLFMRRAERRCCH